MSQGMAGWLSKYIDMSSGVPCESTFINTFNIIKPTSMEEILRQLSDLMREKVPQELISFDGQTSRGTADKYKGLTGIHLMNAWSVDNRICLGQLKVDDKSNEIIAMPKLMETLNLKGTIITADAMNTQKATVNKAIEKEADYVFPVKGNQASLLKDIQLAFEGLDKDLAEGKKRWEREVKKAEEDEDKNRLKGLLSKGAPNYKKTQWESIEKGHGRIENRSCMAIPVGDLPSKEGWTGIKSIVRMCKRRTEKGITTEEVSYYITSLKPEASTIAEITRWHWGVESQHWYLDVVFKQDKSRYRDRIGAQNLAVIRKIALNGLLREGTLKKGIATKQCAAACNPAYRELVLKKLF
jgi:predicted transposase YbfD/YdcC